jgi:hypothetical protein
LLESARRRLARGLFTPILFLFLPFRFFSSRLLQEVVQEANVHIQALTTASDAGDVEAFAEIAHAV